MLTPNQYINLYKLGRENENITDEELLKLRQSYISLSKKEKKKLDREYIKRKNSMSFERWWETITYNILNSENIEKPKTIRVEWNEKSLKKFKLKSKTPKYHRNSR